MLTSQIEGTQATLVDLLTFGAQDGAEQSAAPNADVEEVCNYLDALAYARAQLADPKGLPLSMRLLNETHARLMRGVRGRGEAARRGAPQPELDRGKPARQRSTRSRACHCSRTGG